MAQCHKQYDKVTVDFSISKPRTYHCILTGPVSFLQPWHVQARSELENPLLQVRDLAFVPSFRHSKRDTIPQQSPMKKFSVSSPFSALS